jgi:tetratricopeptide (TPR) repeat protein
MAVDSTHPGAHHFYIHAVEAIEPERAIAVAERLADLMPGAGHLVHMPSHIYIRVGRYADAVAINEHAAHADETWIRDQRPGPGFYLAAYYPHNYDFLTFAASMLGQRVKTLDAADKNAAAVPRDLLGAPGYTLLQHHLTKRLQARVRFAAWSELLAEPKPVDTLAHAVGIWHYARGRALAATGDMAAATAELNALRALATDSALSAQRMEYNSSGAVLGIAVDVLAGFVALATGNQAAAVSQLEAAVRKEDALTYGEPPEWTVPTRQDLGVVLLAAGRPRDAARVFREDLAKFPQNGWSLRGLAESLRAMGKTAEAAEVEAQFRKAWAMADSSMMR